MKNGIIFDFDGVIINSFELQKKALQESYQRVGGKGKISEEEFFSHSGNSLENIFTEMGLPLEMVKFYKAYSREHIDCIQVYSGIRKLLCELQKKEISCSICTGKERSRTLEILEQLKLNDLFIDIVCSDDVERAKPYPDSLLLVAKRMNCSLENVIMVGDAPNDIKCAKNAGVISIGVTWGEVPRNILIEEKPDYIADTVDELAFIINNFFENIVNGPMSRFSTN